MQTEACLALQCLCYGKSLVRQLFPPASSGELCCDTFLLLPKKIQTTTNGLCSSQSSDCSLGGLAGYTITVGKNVATHTHGRAVSIPTVP
jgi:hypothetical protein